MVHAHVLRFKAICGLAVLLTIGLLAITPVPVLAQSGAWALTGNMKTGRSGQTATLLPNGLVLVSGGFDGSNSLASAELYNPATGKWTATGSMNTARDGHTATLLSNGQVLVAGGFANGSSYFSSADLYNPATGTWTVTGSMSTARTAHTAHAASERPSVGGGRRCLHQRFDRDFLQCRAVQPVPWQMDRDRYHERRARTTHGNATPERPIARCRGPSLRP